MTLDRRTFLQRTALGVAGLAGTARVQAADGTSAFTLPAFNERAPESFWSAVRALYPLSRTLTYFNTGGLGPTSEPVLATVA